MNLFSISHGAGFHLFDTAHLMWLLLAVFLLVTSALWYRTAGERRRKIWRIAVGVLLIVEELLKTVFLLYNEDYRPQDLPLELCSINIFLIFFHAVWASPVLGNFLYTFCIPGSLAALLFPGWTHLPVGSFLHIHSFTVHILLLLYPTVLALNGEFPICGKRLLQSLILLRALAGVIYAVNLLLGTNFMFLMEAEPGNPLFWFEKKWGSHLWGFLVIGVPVLLALYFPPFLRRRIRDL